VGIGHPGPSKITTAPQPSPFPTRGKGEVNVESAFARLPFVRPIKLETIALPPELGARVERIAYAIAEDV
jgi:hypothetical protein